MEKDRGCKLLSKFRNQKNKNIKINNLDDETLRRDIL